MASSNEGLPNSAASTTTAASTVTALNDSGGEEGISSSPPSSNSSSSSGAFVAESASIQGHVAPNVSYTAVNASVPSPPLPVAASPNLTVTMGLSFSSSSSLSHSGPNAAADTAPASLSQSTVRNHGINSSSTTASITPTTTTATTTSVPQTTMTVYDGAKNNNSNNNARPKLYDRDEELHMLRQEYASMVQQARGAVTERALRHRNSTSVICVAGKAGTGKTSLVQALMQQETQAAAAAGPVATAGASDRSPYFLFGKFSWPTTSVTSSLKARPHVPNSASMSGEAMADDTQYQPALAQAFNLEQEQQHEPFAAFCMALEHLLEQIEAKGPVVADKLRARILYSIGGPSSVPVLGEVTPKFATFLQQQTLSGEDGRVTTATTTTTAPGEAGGEEDGGGGGAPRHKNGYNKHNNNNSNIKDRHVTDATNSKDFSHPNRQPSSTESTFKSAAPMVKNTRVENRVPRLKYVLRQLFRGLCHHNRNPCVLVLDDAQWADPESLELARDLHADLDNPLFLLILTWRTNDIHEEESCYTAMGSSIGIFASDSVRRINLQNLSTDSVTQLVAQAVQRPLTNVKGLSKVVYEKTGGNPLFVNLFMEYLEKEGYIKWRSPREIWLWDEARIADLNISHNFLGLIVAKIFRLPTASRLVLQIVACLGQAFDEESVCTIIDKMDTVEMFDVNIKHNDAMTCLDGLVREGLLERHGASTSAFSLRTTFASLRTTFAHDQMQEAAYQLIPKHSRQLLQLRIGERLLEIMEEQRSEYVSFLGIDLCSRGIGYLSSKERMGLALYNLLAGEKCLSRASFATALAYFEFGLTSLRISDFLKGRLSLELSFGAMEAAFGVDDFDKVRLHYDRITGSGSTPEDILRAHVLLIRATGTRGNLKEALATGFSVLRSLGVKTVVDTSGKVSLLVHMTKTKMALRKHTEETLSNLPEMSSTKFRHGLTIVEAMMPFAYVHDRQLFMCLSMKIVRWSIKYGVTSHTPLFFAALGSSATFQMKDMRLAAALGNAALRLMQRFGTRENAGMIRFVVHSLIQAWTVEPQIVHRNLEANCRSSLVGGDLLPAFCSLATAYAISFDCGHQRLDEMESLGESYCLEIKQGGNRLIAGIHDATWLIVLNLRCDSSEVKLETASVLSMTQDEALSYGNDILEFAFLSRDLQLAYLLGEYKRGDDVRKRSEAPIRSMTSSPHLILHYSYCALNCLMLCASNGPEPVRKNSYYKMAVLHLAKLNKWQKEYGYRFGGHLVKLIQAEFSRVEGRYSLAEKNYQGSVWIASRQGNHRDKGLAHELAGRFFWRDRKDDTWAAYHFDQAIQAYHSWGATLLVNRLLEKYGEVVSSDPGRSDLSNQLLSAQSHESSVV
ncbi:hypothetical protein ACA910_004373 [Epithemia clementina (nom. ined.)]